MVHFPFVAENCCTGATAAAGAGGGAGIVDNLVFSDQLVVINNFWVHSLEGN